MSPNSAVVGNSIAVTLTGTNFTSGATVSAPAGITVSNLTVVSATQITANFAIAANAATGTFSVKVTTSAGTSSSVSFTINPAPAPAPTLTGISPNSGMAGNSVAVTLTGTNFTSSATINAPSGITYSNLSVVSSTQITATFAIASNAATGTVSVKVTTSAGTSGSMAFTINAASPPGQPTLASINPNNGVVGSSFAITLGGTNFVSGAAINAPGGITVSNLAVVSATQITANFAVAANAASGTFGVTVTTSAGTSGSVSFTINPAPPPGGDSIVINAANTHQTWRGYDGAQQAREAVWLQPLRSAISAYNLCGTTLSNNPYTFSGPPVLLNTTLWQQALSYEVNDLGLNGATVFNPQGLIATNGSVNTGVFTTTFSYRGCPLNVDTIMSNGGYFRNIVVSAGMIPYFHMNYGGGGNWGQSGLDLASWQSSAATAASDMTTLISELNSRYGYYPDVLYFGTESANCCTGANGTIWDSGGGYASWMGGFLLNAKTDFTNAGIPTTLGAPNSLAPDDVLIDLAGNGTYGGLSSVLGAEGKLGRLSYHWYNSPVSGSPSVSAAINVSNRALRDAVDVELNESEVSVYGMASGLFQDGWGYLVGSASWPGMIPLINQAGISAWKLETGQMCQQAGCDPNYFGSNGQTFWANSGGAGGLAWEPDGSAFYLQPRYFAIRQFARYVRPGYVRVDSTSSNSAIVTSAWKKPNGGLNIIVVNGNGTSDTVTVSGLPNAQFTVHKLDPTLCTTTGFARCTEQAVTMTSSGGSLTLFLPGQAVWTLEQN